jgi:hypothetical protein
VVLHLVTLHLVDFLQAILRILVVPYLGNFRLVNLRVLAVLHLAFLRDLAIFRVLVTLRLLAFLGLILLGVLVAILLDGETLVRCFLPYIQAGSLRIEEPLHLLLPGPVLHGLFPKGTVQFVGFQFLLEFVVWGFLKRGA